jgi:predicted nucleic acid-binding protein
LPKYFFDSSALVKLHHPEAGTPQVEAIFQQADRRVIISRLTIIELESALSTKVRTGAISIDHREKVGLRILQHGSDGTFGVVALTEPNLSTARQLIQRHGVESGLRTLDAL